MMSAIPRAYPLLARLRYANFEDGNELPVVENAWWEGRWDGGRALGAVVEAWNHPRSPHRLRVHLRLKPDDTPQEMELSLLRPDGEGQASYRFEPEAVHVEGIWNGEPFQEVLPMSAGYTVAPYCIAADGLHFISRREQSTEIQPCYMVNPKTEDHPLKGILASFTQARLETETLDVNGTRHTVTRFRAAFLVESAPPADYWITEEGYTLRMISHRRTGEPVEIVCVRYG